MSANFNVAAADVDVDPDVAPAILVEGVAVVRLDAAPVVALDAAAAVVPAVAAAVVLDAAAAVVLDAELLDAELVEVREIKK